MSPLWPSFYGHAKITLQILQPILINSPNHLLYLSLTHQANIPSALNHPRDRYRTTRDHLNAHSLPTLFKLSSPKLLTLFCLVFTIETPINTLGPTFFALSALGWPWCFPMWPCMACHDSRVYGPLTIIFSWQSFCCLHILLYLIKQILGTDFRTVKCKHFFRV